MGGPGLGSDGASITGAQQGSEQGESRVEFCRTQEGAGSDGAVRHVNTHTHSISQPQTLSHSLSLLLSHSLSVSELSYSSLSPLSFAISLSPLTSLSLSDSPLFPLSLTPLCVSLCLRPSLTLVVRACLLCGPRHFAFVYLILSRQHAVWQFVHAPPGSDPLGPPTPP